VLAIGGSTSTDGGAGLIAALGARLLTASGAELAVGGGALREVATVDLSIRAWHGLASSWPATSTTCSWAWQAQRACSALHKGADTAQIAVLEAGLTAFSRVLQRALRDAGSGEEPVAAGAEGGVRDERDLALMPGAGAAGGVGFAALAVLRAERRSRVDVVVDLIRLRDRLVGADLVITGDGPAARRRRRSWPT
jgi:glycerate kinase